MIQQIRHPAIPENIMSEAQADDRLLRDRGDIMALIAKADQRLLVQDNRAANAFYTAAIKRAAAGSPTQPHDADSIVRAQAMISWLGEIFKRHLIDALENAGYPASKQHPKFHHSLQMMLGEISRPAEYRQFPQMPQTYFYPDTNYGLFFDTNQYDWVPKLEAEFPALREEALGLLTNHQGFTPYMNTDLSRPQNDHHGLMDNPNWSKLHLWQNGGPVDEHVKYCPKIFDAMVKHVPLCHIGKRAPSIMLSLLRPGAHIPPHTGVVNCRLICHLPLVVPQDCGLRVGDQTVEWEEGKVIAFDDSIQHEAWNRSPFDRLVILFDIWRPELSLDERAQIQVMFEAVENYR